MARRSVESRGQELLTLARKLAQTSALTWVEANNAIYGPGGPFVRLFPNAKDRAENRVGVHNSQAQCNPFCLDYWLADP